MAALNGLETALFSDFLNHGSLSVMKIPVVLLSSRIPCFLTQLRRNFYWFLIIQPGCSWIKMVETGCCFWYESRLVSLHTDMLAIG